MTEQALLDPQRLIDEYREYKVSKSRSFAGPSQANRCSTLGHPCTAYCFFDRTVAPKDRKEVTPELAAIFDEGRSQERLFQRDLLDMGWNVEGGQGSLSWPEFNITGHRDFKVSVDRSEDVRSEFKSVHPALFDKLNSVKDVKEHKAYFIQKWYFQVVLYMLLDGSKKYWLVLKNKSTGQPKVIVFEWSDELWQDAEAMLKKAEVVNALVAARKVEEKHKIAKAGICSGCEFLTICNPPLDFGPGVAVVDELQAAEMTELAGRREELKAAHDEYEGVDEELKDRVKQFAGTEREMVVFGDWAASVQRQNVKSFTVKEFTKKVVKFLRLKRDFDVPKKEEKSLLERQLEASIKVERSK